MTSFKLVKIAVVTVALVAGLASGQTNLNELGPAELHRLMQLEVQVRAIEDWVCTTFKESAWNQLARWIDQSAATKGWDVVERALREGNPRELMPADARAGLDDLRAAAAGAAASELSNAEQEGKKVAVRVRRDAVEVMFTYHAIRPFLNDSLKRLSSIGSFGAEESRERVRTVVVQCLRRYQQLKRHLAILEALQHQPIEILEVLGVDRQALSRVLRDALPPEVLDNLSNVPDEAALRAAVQRVADHAKKQIDVRALELAAMRIVESVQARIAQLAQPIKELVASYERIFTNQQFDIPANAPADSWFLRFKLAAEAGKGPRSSGATTSASVWICRPAGGVGSIGSALSDDPEVRKPRPTVDEIPLGITVHGVVVKEARSDLPLGFASVGSRPRTDLDTKVFLEAMRQLGLPTQLSLRNLGVEMPAIDRIAVQGVIAMPDVASSLPPEWRRVVTKPRRIVIDTANLVEGTVRKLVKDAVDGMQTDFENGLRDALRRNERNADLRFIGIESRGKWSDGRIGYVVTGEVRRLGPWQLGAGELPLRLPVECREMRGRWSLRIAPHIPGPEIAELLRRRVIDKTIKPVLNALEGDIKQHAGRLEEYLEVVEVRFEVENPGIVGAIRFAPNFAEGEAFDVPFALRLAPVGFTADLDGLRQHLEARAVGLLKKLAERLAADLLAGLEDDLTGRSFDALGARVEIKNAEYVARHKFYRLDIQARIGDRTFAAKDLRLLGEFQLEGSVGIKGGRFDFGHVELEPGIEELVREMTGVDAALQLSQVRKLADGFTFEVTVRIDSLDMDVPCGRFTLGPGLAKVEAPDLSSVMKRVLADRLGDGFEIGDLGPVRAARFSVDVTGDRGNGLGGIVVGLNAKLPIPSLPESLALPFEMDVAPKIGPPRFDEGSIRQLATSFLGTVMPTELFGGVEIKEILTAAPYGVRFDATVNVVDIVEVKVRGFGLTRLGVELPASVAIQVPAIVPLGPTGLVLVRPGVEVGIREKKLALLGEVTIAPGEGVREIAMIRSRLSSPFEDLKKNPRLQLKGTFVLVRFLPVLDEIGTLYLKDAKATLEIKSVGFMAKLFNLRGLQVIDAKRGRFSQGGNISILGFNVARAQVDVDIPDVLVRAEGEAHLLIADAQMHIQASPNLTKMSAGAEVAFKVGSFKIATAGLKVELAMAELGFGVMGFKFRIIVPGVTSLTPSLVLDIILSALDFDPIAFFKALLKREIVVNLLDPGKGDPNGAPSDARPLGDGDPVPTGDPSDEKAPPQGTPPAGPAADATDHTPPPGGQELERAPAPPGGSWPQVGPESDEGHGKVPTQMITYKRGKDSVRFEPDTKMASQGRNGLWVQVTESRGGHRWSSHFSIPEAVKKHLSEGKVMVVNRFSYRLKTGEWTCRNGYRHPSAQHYVTVDAEGRAFVVGLHPAGKHQEIDVDLSQIGAKRDARPFLEWLADEKNQFKSGDLELLTEFARRKLRGESRKIKVKRVPPESVSSSTFDAFELERPVGYLYQTKDFRDRDVLRFLSREGTKVEFAKGTKLDALVRFDRDSPLRSSVILFLVSARRSGYTPRCLVGDSRAVAFWASSGSDDVIATIARDGRILKAVRPRAWSRVPQSLEEPHLADATKGIAKELVRQLSTGKWDEVTLRGPERNSRLALLERGAAWRCSASYERDESVALSIDSLAGSSIESAWVRWTNEGVFRRKPFADLGSDDAKRWFIDQIVAGRKWPEIWTVNPVLLIKKLSMETP